MNKRAKQAGTSAPLRKGVPQEPEPVQETHASGPGPALRPHSARVQRRLSGPADLLILQKTIGNQAVMRLLAKQGSSVQAKLAEHSEEERVQLQTGAQREPSNAEIHAAAARGVSTPATPLPFLGRIQASFGRHSIGHIKAHVGPEAARASQDMNALAFASGDHVVFGGSPDLHTAAHEAAHVVQQQAGMHLAGGVGQAGDIFEQHAEAVANTVEEGGSVEGLLNPFATSPAEEPPQILPDSSSRKSFNIPLAPRARVVGATNSMPAPRSIPFASEVTEGSINPVQRIIKSGDKRYNSPDAAFFALYNTNYRMGIYAVSLTGGILPIWFSEDRHFKNDEEMHDAVSPLLPFYQQIYEVTDHKTLASYITAQRRVQEAIISDPNLMSAFRSLVATVGFEHEFADMKKDGPLGGVSHLELAQSTETLPFTNLPFFVETDASNALELVSPPFLFPSVKAAPVPHPDTVEEVDKLIRTTIKGIIEPNWWNFVLSADINFTELLAGLNKATGFNFELKPEVVIKAQHLSHHSDLGKLAPHLKPASNDPNNLVMNPTTIGNIKVGTSTKDDSGISTQVNFATDMRTATIMNSHSGLSGLSDKITEIFKTIQTDLEQRIPAPQESETATAFYNEMIVKLGSLFGIYSQQYVLERQSMLHGDLMAKATGSDRNLGRLDEQARDEFRYHTYLFSFVKDVRPGWIKDHLESMAKGMLQPGDNPRLLESIRKLDVNAYTLPTGIRAALAEGRHTDPGAHWDHFIRQLKAAVESIGLILEGGTMLSEIRPRVDLYGTDDRFVGARQDTYLDPGKVQQPGIWDRRLHVLEIRRGKPSEQLKTLTERL